MSSIIGFVGTPSASIAQQLSLIKDRFQYVYQEGLLTLLADTSLSTVLYSDSPGEKHWVMSGSGVCSSSDGSRFMTVKDWSKIIAMGNPESYLRKQDGHFLLLCWNHKELTVFTDSIGLKSLYYIVTEEAILFSDTPDFLLRTEKPELSLSEFGSHWLLFNKLSDNSIFSNVNRLVGGKSITISLEGSRQFTESGYRWIPSLSKSNWNRDSFTHTLHSLVSVVSTDRKMTLSLSGGMDSRVLLSILISNKTHSIHTHTFGEAASHDCVIAKEMSEFFGFHNEHYQSELTSADEALTRIRAYTNVTQVNNAASAFLQFQNYYALNGKSYFIIDGGFGEIWRREFFVRLFLKGESAILNRNLKDILPALRLHRANIFQKEAINQMENGIESELTTLFNYLPSLSDVSFEDWLDIFAIKTRLLNYYANEQSLLDSIIQNVMPFASVSLLNTLCSVPTCDRKNGKLFKDVISSRKPELKQFRLAKNNLTVPFSSGTIQLRILKKISRMLKKTERTGSVHSLLILLKPFIQDTLASRSFHDFPYYDTKAIQIMADRFYKTENDFADELDWWLAFEIFRQEYL